MCEPKGTATLRRLGDFEILHELGRGGMGSIYGAQQVSLNRKAALRVLSSGLGTASEAVARLRREQIITLLLPGIEINTNSKLDEVAEACGCSARSCGTLSAASR